MLDIVIPEQKRKLKLFENLSAAEHYARTFKSDLDLVTFLRHEPSGGFIVKIKDDLYDNEGKFSHCLSPACWSFIDDHFFERELNG